MLWGMVEAAVGKMVMLREVAGSAPGAVKALSYSIVIARMRRSVSKGGLCVRSCFIPNAPPGSCFIHVIFKNFQSRTLFITHRHNIFRRLNDFKVGAGGLQHGPQPRVLGRRPHLRGRQVGPRRRGVVLGVAPRAGVHLQVIDALHGLPELVLDVNVVNCKMKKKIMRICAKN